MEKVNVIFLHPSAHPKRPMFITMPMGVFNIMNQVKSRCQVSAINVGLEMSLQPTYQILDELKKKCFDVAAIDLHWHEHSFTALELARLCKEANPECKVVLGGMTASLFAREIVSNHEFVDFVIRGDGENSFCTLIDNISKGHIDENVSRISGITYHNNDDIIENPTSWTSTESADEDYADLTSLKHWEEYLKSNIDFYSRYQYWRSYWLCIGKGCQHNCSFCGGGSDFHKRSFRRPSMFFRSEDNVFKDIRKLTELGMDVVNFSHDLQMSGKDYWHSLFRRIRQENIDINGYMELNGLIDDDFAREFANTFNLKLSTLVISPLSGNEEVRTKNGKGFKNTDMMKKIDVLEDYGIPYVLYFATGLPFESETSFNETISLTEEVLGNSHLKMVFNTPLTLDPGSPMYCHPERFGVFPHLITFDDYYNRCKRRAEGLAYDLFGYHTDLLSTNKMMCLLAKWNEFFKDQIPQLLAKFDSSVSS